MMHRAPSVFFGLLFVICIAPVNWAWAADDATFSYVSSKMLPPSLLPAPPAENTIAWKQQIALVHIAQKHISKTGLQAIHDEQHLRLSLMTDIIGPDFTAEHFPITFQFLSKILQDSNLITETDKQFWHTRRPYLIDHHIRLLVAPINASPSYPSGHTSETRVLAEVLGLLYPDHLNDLRARAEDIAIHRVEAGVHYPIDLEGGRLLAMLIVGALIENDDFQADLDAAREKIIRNGEPQ